jgi:hypothetical protein
VTDSVRTKRPRAARFSRLRLGVGAMTVVALLVAVAFSVEAYAALANAFTRAVFPYAQNQFSEASLMVELHRMAAGQAAYQSTLAVNSYPYGPLYLFVLNVLRGGQPPNVVSARLVTITLGLLTIVPMVFSSLFIARRAGVSRRNAVANAVTGVTAGVLGAAVITRSITFDAVHPDGLLFFLIGSALAIYYAIAGHILRPVFVWALCAIGVAATFTELHSFAIVPALLLVLASTRDVSYRLALLALGAYVMACLILIASMPGDARAWTFLVPIAQPIEFSRNRIRDFLAVLVHWQPYIGLAILAVPAAVAILWRRERTRALWIDGGAVAIVLATALGGYFRSLALWNTLSLICIVCVPYFGAMLGSLATPRVLAPLNRVLAIACVVLAGAMCLGLNGPPKQEPSVQIYSQMDAAATAATQLCGRAKTIVVIAMPELFFSCQNAVYSLGRSFQQLAAAFPEYYAGPTAFEKPITAPYVVTIDSLPLPGRWATDYVLERQLPGVTGFDQNYFPLQLQFYRHR